MFIKMQDASDAVINADIHLSIFWKKNKHSVLKETAIQIGSGDTLFEIFVNFHFFCHPSAGLGLDLTTVPRLTHNVKSTGW